MKKILKWTGIVLGALLLLITGTAFYLRSSAQNRLEKKYQIQPKYITVPSDSTAIAAGKKWVSSLCINCHGENLAGTEFFHTPDLGSIPAPNLTPAGACKEYTDLDWDRAIRHGVSKAGLPLLIMPAKDFQYLSDEHIAQIIAYLKTLPPVDKSWPRPSTTFLCDVLFQLGAFGDALNAETIDHQKPSHYAPERGVTAEYGQYVVKVFGCKTCHGENLNGGKDPNPEAPMGPNLTPGGNLVSWGDTAFIAAMRTGITPMGKELNSKFMPWKEIGNFEDDQLKAIYTFLMAQPNLPTADLKK
ncbi:MAG: c-type cytochrome [Saprospiraceae bacterium]|nr:c-type cytochrome [Saprospiraceae bacterium]